jgi:signal transduction histidine kinase
MDRGERHTGRARGVQRRVTDDVDAPVAFCSESGVLELAAPAGIVRLQRMGFVGEAPTQLPEELWDALSLAPLGQAVVWRAPDSPELALECTRYRVRSGGFMLWLREVFDPNLELLEDQRYRQDATRRLIACIARDVRGSVATIVYSSDYLDGRAEATASETVRETVREIGDAGRRLQLTVDGLLDYTKLGPAVFVRVSLHDVLNRAQTLLRSLYRNEAHRFRVELASDAEWVRGNPVAVEQIFINLLLSFGQGADSTRNLILGSEVSPSGSMITVKVSRDCQLAPTSTDTVATSMASTTARLALLDARTAAESLGGQLLVDERSQTPSFIVTLPRAEGPR